MRLRSTSKEARAREAKNLRDISRDSGGSMVAPAMTAASQIARNGAVWVGKMR